MLYVNFDVSELAELLGMNEAMKTEASRAAKDLGQMVLSKAKELASEKLHARRQMFISALSMAEEEGVVVVSLEASARWIDDGQPPHSMLDALLASPKAKRAKDGSLYTVVPFKHGPGMGAGVTSPAQQDLISTVKSEMKKRGIPFGKIEKDAQGQAKIGRLHAFDIMHVPTKSADGPGQGKGPIGEVKQGPTGTPFLKGVGVYQTKNAKGKVQKSIMTFRTASSKHRSQSRWEHPGIQGADIMQEAADWAYETWKKEIAPAIVEKIAMSTAT